MFPAETPLILKRSPIAPDFDYDVLENDVVGGGRIILSPAAPDSRPLMWALAYGHHEDRSPTHGYGATREAAMAAFAKSWRRQ
jgi:hypothetical protein